MVARSYILDTFRVNGKTIWCLKHKEYISNLSTFDFRSNLGKALVLVCACWQKLDGLTSIIELKIKIFLGIALKVTESAQNFENRYQCTDKRKRGKVQENNCQSKSEKDNIPMYKEQCQSSGKSICRAYSSITCNPCLQWHSSLT